jgi:hypothetical protein
MFCCIGLHVSALIIHSMTYVIQINLWIHGMYINVYMYQCHLCINEEIKDEKLGSILIHHPLLWGLLCLFSIRTVNVFV